LNGAKITPKYSKTKLSRPVRLCKYETKTVQDSFKNEHEIKNLLVKNLSKDVSAHQFFKTFRQFGDIRSCKLNIDSSGQSKGYGYVNYYNSDNASKAKRELTNYPLEGKNLIITDLIPGKSVEKKRNNVYVKNIPKEKFSDEDLKVSIILLYLLENF
jgi:RNA recognition motif-containing protein